MVQVERVSQATLTHRQWHLNYYHSITESAFEVYNLACTVFKLCNLHTKEDFVPVFLDKAGVAGWDTRLGESGGQWGTVLPPAAEALQCFYPKPAIWLADAQLHSKVKAVHLCRQVSQFNFIMCVYWQSTNAHATQGFRICHCVDMGLQNLSELIRAGHACISYHLYLSEC